jgi:protein involved in polysaccharide export with SLBB domain
LVVRFIRRASKPLTLAWAPGLLFLVGGCQSLQLDFVSKPAAAPVADAVAPVSPDYPVVFPDVVELSVAGRPECSGRRLVYPDGRIDLGPCGGIFAEGHSARELKDQIAAAAGVPAQQVNCRVAAARSRVIYLVGPGAEHPRAVPFAGPERVAELLQRAGGLSPDVHPTDIRVVRRNVAKGTPTETFKVDLAAVRNGDERTNVVLEPNDEIHVAGEKGITLAAFLPDRVRP